MKNYTPYILPRPFNGFNIPIPMQTAYIKNFLEMKGLKFSFPIAEFTTSKNFTVLKKYLDQKKTSDIIVVSIFVFPINESNLMKEIFKNYVNKKINFYGILETKMFSIPELLKWSSDISILRKNTLSYEDVFLNKKYDL